MEIPDLIALNLKYTAIMFAAIAVPGVICFFLGANLIRTGLSRISKLSSKDQGQRQITMPLANLLPGFFLIAITACFLIPLFSVYHEGKVIEDLIETKLTEQSSYPTSAARETQPPASVPPNHQMGDGKIILETSSEQDVMLEHEDSGDN